jgi:hypothetical protein
LFRKSVGIFCNQDFSRHRAKLTQKDAIQSAENGQLVFGVQYKATTGDIPSFACFPFPFRFDGVLEAFKVAILSADNPITATAL